MPPEPIRPASGVLTFEQYAEIFPNSKANTDADFLAFVSACERFEIDSPVRLAAFCANDGHESMGRTRFVENLNYSESGLMKTWPRKFKTREIAVEYKRKGPQGIANKAYAYVNGNGDEASGDGWLFRGRGDPQLTGRSNYRRAGAALGLDLEANPDLAAIPANGALIFAWYWKTNGCNEMADAGDFDGVCDAINLGRRTNAIGDSNGYADRVIRWKKCRTVLGLPAIPNGVAA